MRTRRQRPTPSTRGGRVKGTPRVRNRQRIEQFIRGNRQKPGGTKPKPKAVPKGTKTGPAVKGKMSTRPKSTRTNTGRPFPKIDLTKPRTGPTPRPKPPRPTRPPTRRPSRRPTGGMDAIRRRMRGRRRGFQR